MNFNSASMFFQGVAFAALTSTVPLAVMSWPALAQNNNEEMQSRVDELQYRRFERTSCGVRKVDYSIVMTTTFEISKADLDKVSSFSISYTDANGDEGFSDVNIPLLRSDGEISVDYSDYDNVQNIENEAEVVSNCVDGQCNMTVPIYLGDDYMELTPFDGSFDIVALDASDNDIANYGVDLLLLNNLPEASLNNNYEDFSVIVEPDLIIVDPNLSKAERNGGYRAEVHDSTGVRILDLDFDARFEDDYWVIPWADQLTYLQIDSEDASGIWNNVVQVVDLTRPVQMNTFEGSCHFKDEAGNG